MTRADLSRRSGARPGDAWRRCAAVLAVVAGLAIGERGAFAVTGGGNGGYESEQGPDVFGTKDPGLEGAKIAVVPAQPTTYQQIRIENGQLHAQKTGADVAGAGVVGLDLVAIRTVGADLGKPATLHIAAARPHRNVFTHVTWDQVWEYEIQVVDGGKSRPLCNEAHNVALAIPGLWKGGAASAFDQWLSFACVPIGAPDAPAAAAKHRTLQKPATYTRAQRTALGLPLDEVEGLRWGGGAAAKCIDYGYAPWVDGVAAFGKTTRTQHKVASSVDAAREFHNLCTRAMTADYEAHGTSHTIRGTLIRIFDLTNLPLSDCTRLGLPINCTLVPPSQATAPLQPFQRAETVEAALGGFQRVELVAPEYAALYYESVWQVNAGVARASCLAKVRWQTIDATHLGQVADSTPKKHHRDQTWQYCDQRAIGAFASHGQDTRPVLVVYSAINEKGLYRFKISGNISGTPVRYLTTTRVQVVDEGVELAPGLPCDAPPCMAVSFEGDVLSPDEPKDTFKAWKTTPIFLMRNNSGDFATIQLDGTKQTPKLPDGYHFAEIGPTAAARPNATDAQPAKPVARPGLGTVPKASAGSPTWSAAPEGYLFDAAPDLPDSDRFGMVDAKASRLHVFRQGERYCTALEAHVEAHAEAQDECPGTPHDLRFVLLPAAMLVAQAPVAVEHPGPREGDPQLDRRAQPGAAAPAPVAKPAETAPR